MALLFSASMLLRTNEVSDTFSLQLVSTPLHFNKHKALSQLCNRNVMYQFIVIDK